MIVFLLLMAASIPEPVHLAASPQPAYIEEGAFYRSLNFDIIVTNSTNEPLDIDEVALSVYDLTGKLVLRRFVDGNGSRPSIHTIDVAEVPAHGSALVFNPFHQFDRSVDLARLVYDVKLSGKKGQPVHSARAVIQPVAYRTKTDLILPLKGRQIVYDGHDFYAHHRRWDYTMPFLQKLGFSTNFMRYSYDLVPIDDQGNMASGEESRNESWFGFGRELRAAGDGIIAAMVDDHPDDRTFDPTAMNGDTMKLFGNYLVIDHGNGEFSLYGHIHQGSHRVKVGDRVRQGQPVAAVGASGSSKFPHLHYELQTARGTSSEGLPSYFRNFDRLVGSKTVHVERGAIESGEIVKGR